MKQAHLVERGANFWGGTYEIWDIGDGNGIYVDYVPCTFDTGKPETMALPYDMLRRMIVTSWTELRMWDHDATGGKAMRELGYEPVEEG